MRHIFFLSKENVLCLGNIVVKTHYCSVQNDQNQNLIKMRVYHQNAAFLLSPYFITQGRMGARKVALIMMQHSHFDRTLR